MTAVRPAPISVSHPVAPAWVRQSRRRRPAGPGVCSARSLGLLLIVFCATAVAVYASNAGHRQPVLVVLRTGRRQAR